MWDGEQDIRLRLRKLASKTDSVIASQESMESLLDNVESEIDHLHSGQKLLSAQTEALAHIFVAGIDDISTRLALQQNSLTAIQSTLESPLGTQARELRRRGKRAFQEGWTDEALDDLTDAIELNYQDYLSYLLLGHLHRHQLNRPADAVDYYEDAAKYARPFSLKDRAGALVAASRTSLEELGDKRRAYGYAKEAWDANEKYNVDLERWALPQESEGLYGGRLPRAMVAYQVAVTAGQLDGSQEFLKWLERSVRMEEEWMVIAYHDPHARGFRDAVEQLAQELMCEYRDTLRELEPRIRFSLVLLQAGRDRGYSSLYLSEEQYVRLKGVADCLGELSKLESFVDVARVYKETWVPAQELLSHLYGQIQEERDRVRSIERKSMPSLSELTGHSFVVLLIWGGWSLVIGLGVNIVLAATPLWSKEVEIVIQSLVIIIPSALAAGIFLRGYRKRKILQTSLSKWRSLLDRAEKELDPKWFCMKPDAEFEERRHAKGQSCPLLHGDESGE